MIIFRKGRLETELGGRRDEWRKQMEISVKSVADEAISRITRDSEEMEKGVSSRVAKMGEAISEIAAQTENKFTTLRDALNDQDDRSRQTLLQLEAADLRIQDRVSDEAAKLAQASGELDLKLSGLRQYLAEQNDRLQESLRRLQAADERMNEQLFKLDRIVEAAGQNLESRANAVLETTGQEMNRRAEETISAWTEQVRTIERVTGQEIDRFTDHLKTELSRRLESTNETLKNIEAATMAAKESLKSTQENLSKVSEQVLESANGRMHAFVQDLVANAEHQVEEFGRAATAKGIGQLGA